MEHSMTNMNTTKHLSSLFDTIVPLTKDAFRLTKTQKNRLKEIQSKTKEHINKKEQFVFHSHQQRQPFSVPLIENPMQSAYEHAFPNQKQFGQEIARAFEEDLRLLSVLAVAPTQSGKTGSMISVLYECFRSPTLNMHPDNVFLFTSLSSREWVSQTQFRFPDQFQNQIYHRNQLKDFVEKVKSKTNILILFDESHIANKLNQTLHKLYKYLDLYNISHLYDKNIKTIHFTATPEVLSDDLTKHWSSAAKVMHMAVPPTYISVQSLVDQGRVLPMKDLCGYNPITKTVLPSVYDHIEELRPHLGPIPKIHIIRTPRGALHHVVIQNFKHVFSNISAHFISEPTISNFDHFTNTSVSVHTFLFIKDKLRCAKTLQHANVGILYERTVLHPNHTSLLQGLLGRLTGYHHNTHSVIFTLIPITPTHTYSSFLAPF